MTGPAGPVPLSSTTDLSQHVHIKPPFTQAPFQELFEIDETCHKILQRQFRCVALQFPDELLSESVRVYQALRKRLPLEIELYVLADTTYGSCCVDEIAAEHVSADVIVHYGHSCLSRPSRLPCVMVFTKQLADIAAVAKVFAEFCSKEPDTLKGKTGLHLAYDVSFEWRIGKLHEALQSSSPLPISHNSIDKLSYLEKGKRKAPPCQDATSCCCPRPEEDPASLDASTEDDGLLAANSLVFYFGKPSLQLTNIMMRNPGLDVLICDPSAEHLQIERASIQASKLLMRRYAAIQKARDADVFGIVVGTLGVYRLRALLRRQRKKVYTLCVGKPTPSKLGNYQEVECFVLVACPENSLLLTLPEQSKEYIRPIISPWEMEVALDSGRKWEEGWRIRWNSKSLVDVPQDGRQGDDEDDDVQFSAATGQLRTVRRFGQSDQTHLANGGDSLALDSRLDSDRQIALLMGSAAGEHLSKLHYRGLDPQPNKTAPAAMEEGRSGIARSYGQERTAV